MHEMSLRCPFHCVLKSFVVADFMETLRSRCQEHFSQVAPANAPVYGLIVLLDGLDAFQVVGRAQEFGLCEGRGQQLNADGQTIRAIGEGHRDAWDAGEID